MRWKAVSYFVCGWYDSDDYYWYTNKKHQWQKGNTLPNGEKLTNRSDCAYKRTLKSALKCTWNLIRKLESDGIEGEVIMTKNFRKSGKRMCRDYVYKLQPKGN